MIHAMTSPGGKKTKRRDLTSEERVTAAKIKALFKAKARKEKLKQEDMAFSLGMSASALSQYLNAAIPLNLNIILKFAAYLGVQPGEISPEDPLLAMCDDDLRKIITAYRCSSEKHRSSMIDIAELILSQPANSHTEQ